MLPLIELVVLAAVVSVPLVLLSAFWLAWRKAAKVDKARISKAHGKCYICGRGPVDLYPGTFRSGYPVRVHACMECVRGKCQQ